MVLEKDKQLKLFVFTPYPPEPGGGSNAAFEIFKRIAEKKEVFIFSYRKNKEGTKNLHIYHSILGDISTHNSVIYIIRGILYVICSTIFGILLGIIKKPDIIYGKYIASPSFSAAIVAKILRRPLILHTSGIDIQYHDTKEKAHGFFAPILIIIGKLLRKIDLAFADIVIANNKTDCCIVNKMGFKNVYVIYNGVDTRRFSSNERKRNSMREKLNLCNSFVVSYCGSALPEKNIGLLLNLSKKYQKFKFLFIGPTMKELNVFGEVRENSIATGKIDNVEDYLQVSDIYVHPSQVEGLSNSLLEAMACGLPVITYPAGDAKFFVDNYKNGIIANNFEEFSKYIEILYEDTNLRETLGQHARKTILENFDWNKTAKQIQQIFSEVIDSKHKLLRYDRKKV